MFVYLKADSILKAATEFMSDPGKSTLRVSSNGTGAPTPARAGCAGKARTVVAEAADTRFVRASLRDCTPLDEGSKADATPAAAAAAAV